MAYEAALVWSGLCGVLALYFLWRFTNKKAIKKSNQKPARQVILEATTKRLSDVNTSNENDADGMVGRNPINKELKEKEKADPSAKSVLAKGKLENKKENANQKDKLGVRKVYHVKVRSEGESNTELDPETLLPISRPLTTIDDAYGWIPGFDHFNVATTLLKSIKRRVPHKPKTLLCHDMKGGYTEDRFVQGYSSTTCYRINQWNFIDTFVYFSHNVVTIPPPCWTNCCHSHGVKVLGTFITEWDNGSVICSDILQSVESYKRFAKQLVDIACYYNFDGWLVNIENPIAQDKIENLIGFLRFLTESMHKSKKLSEIIWYDSVTTEGKLEWQNELNGKNSVFFDVCDGIFLNYTWSVHHLSRSSLIAGNQRKFDVYVGVDCFGRGCFGGGGWNTYKALQVIREQNLSAAIFAPGWVLETQGEETFTSNQHRFWQLLMPYLYPHIPNGIPLASSFCQGYGNHYFSDGMKLLDMPWTNLSCQQFQPTFVDEYYQIGSKKGIEIQDMFYCTDDAFQGGGCLKINSKLGPCAEGSRVFIRLFRCECKLPSELVVSFTFKLSHTGLIDAYLLLLLDGEPSYMLLSPDETDVKPQPGEEIEPITIGDKVIYPSCEDLNSSYVPSAQQANYATFKPLVEDSKSNMNQLCTGGKGNLNNWITRYYLINKNDLPALREVRLVCSPKKSDQKFVSQFSLLLGEIRVIAVKDLIPCFPVITNIRCRDTTIEKIAEGCKLSTTMIWDKIMTTSTADMPIIHYDIFCSISEKDGCINQDIGVFLGKSFVESFRIARFEVPDKSSRSVKVYVRPVTECNIKAIRKDWGTVIIEW